MYVCWREDFGGFVDFNVYVGVDLWFEGVVWKLVIFRRVVVGEFVDVVVEGDDDGGMWIVKCDERCVLVVVGGIE